MATKTLYSIEQYNALEEPVGARYELDRGELIVTPSPVPQHGVICLFTASQMYAWADNTGAGQVLSEIDVRVADDTVRRPDIMFFARERVRGIDMNAVPIPIAPDLVIEVVSKYDQPDDLMLKVRQYLQAGVRSVWLLYGKTREAHRYTPAAPHPTVIEAERGGKLEEPEILPDFSLPLARIFG